MPHQIMVVEPRSIAAQCGLRPGDVLRSIDREPVLDQIDYQYLSAREHLILEFERGGQSREIEIEKDAETPLGIVLDSTLMSKPRVCANRCVFCFIDQMPPGMRDTLYVKDDDWRLSLMMGNYITLTNLPDKEFDRIIARHASPLYISIHAMDGEVRARMMGNRRAADISSQLRRLADAGIAFHCQVVLCPGINDGQVLDDTLESLAALYPAARSVALVPVGLTRHREGLPALKPYTRETAEALLSQAAKWQAIFLERLGTRFVFPADEFYCLSGMALPPDEAYEEYPQLENGVGMLRSFQKEFTDAWTHADKGYVKPRDVLIATGVSVAPFLWTLLDAHPLPGVSVRVLPVENLFFGPSVTVAGLLTGTDLRRALAGARADEILLSQAMVRHKGNLFLDEDSLPALQAAIGIPVHIAGCDGAELYYALEGEHYRMEE